MTARLTSGRQRPRRAARSGLGLVVVALLAFPSAASAEVNPTAQAVAAKAAWLPAAPPATRSAGVCLVDTGVSINEDLREAVVAREALDGGSSDDVADNKHGTLMAMTMAAAANDVGMVGANPAVRIVSERAASPTDGRFSFGVYAAAVRRCRSLPAAYNIKVIELALGGIDSSTESRQLLVGAVDAAHGAGISVLAAAGNEPGPVQEPANIPGVLGIGAASATGSACDFSASGPGMDLAAPGCGLDFADPTTLQPASGGQGTSQASALTAAILASLRAYRPELSWEQAEQLLISTASNAALDAAAAFRAAGLGNLVGQDPTPQQDPAAPSPDTAGQAPVSDPGSEGATPGVLSDEDVQRMLGRLSTPRVRSVRAVGSIATIRLAQRPAKMAVEVRVQRQSTVKRTWTTVRTRRAVATTIRVKVARRGVVRILLRMVDPLNLQRPSQTVVRLLRR